MKRNHDIDRVSLQRSHSYMLLLLLCFVAAGDLLAQQTIWAWQNGEYQRLRADSITFVSPLGDLYIVGDAVGYSGVEDKLRFTANSFVDGYLPIDYRIPFVSLFTSSDFHKYVVLEANKDFELVSMNDDVVAHWGSDLSYSATLFDNNGDGLTRGGYIGTLKQNSKLRVTETALYLINVRFNEEGALNCYEGTKSKYITIVKISDVCMTALQSSIGVSDKSNYLSPALAPNIAPGTEALTWKWYNVQLSNYLLYNYPTPSPYAYPMEARLYFQSAPTMDNFRKSLSDECYSSKLYSSPFMLASLMSKDPGKYEVTLKYQLSADTTFTLQINKTSSIEIGESEIDKLTFNAYAYVMFLLDHWNYFGVSTLSSDEGLCPTREGGDWADGGYWRILSTHNWNSYGISFKNIWECMMSGIMYCDSIQRVVEKAKTGLSEAVYGKAMAELDVLRAYQYYVLLDCFGRVPYKEEGVNADNALLSPWQTWAYLVATIEQSADKLPVVNDSNRERLAGRITQGMAYTLLARLYLNAESFGCTPTNVMAVGNALSSAKVNISRVSDFYTNAVSCCNKVIQSKAYSIEDSYFTNFAINNASSKENIFTIVTDGSNNFEYDLFGSKNKMRLQHLTLHYVFQNRYNMRMQPWNGFVARPSFISTYNDYDVRGTGYEGLGTNDTHQWGWFVGPVCPEGSAEPYNDYGWGSVNIVPTISSLDAARRNEGARMYKYELDKKGEYVYDENDFVLLRYADVILMKKEAVLRGGADDAVGIENSDIIALKKRAFAYSSDPVAAFDSAYPNAFTSLGNLSSGILAERGREFTWECTRRRDLIRFGQFEQVEYVTNKDANRRFFPIPFSILNGSSWTQNAGY